jgi:hypothetical protein
MMTDVIWEYTVQWGNPYTEPPDGLPRVLARVQVSAPHGAGAPDVPDEIGRVWSEANAAFVASLPSGTPATWPWGIYVSVIDPAQRQASDEARFRRRRQNLIRRIRRRYPMFAEQMIREALERNPAYYGLTLDEVRQWSSEKESKGA